MGDKSQVTPSPELEGLLPPVTVTVSKQDTPAPTLEGLAEPVPDGKVEAAEDELRGIGDPEAKSKLLSSESVQPLFFRWVDVVLPLGAGADELPS